MIVQVCIALLAFLDFITMPSLWRFAHNRFNYNPFTYYYNWTTVLVAVTLNMWLLVWCFCRLLKLRIRYKLESYPYNSSITQKEVNSLLNSAEYKEFIKKRGSDEINHNWQLMQRKKYEAMVNESTKLY